MLKGLLTPAAHHQVGFHTSCAKGLERAYAKHPAASAGNANNDLFQSVPQRSFARDETTAEAGEQWRIRD